MATRREQERREQRRTSARDWAKQQEHGDSGCIMLPEGVDLYKLKPGTHRLDFMPFLAGRNNPRADEGMEHFERTYDLHWIPTPGRNRPVACRWACFGEKCAVCDWLRRNGGSADEELVKGMRAKTRHLWLVNDKPGDAKNPVKILDTNDRNRGTGFGELVVDAINILPEESAASAFALVGGYTTVIVVKDLAMGNGKTYAGATSIQLQARRYDYPESLLAKMPCLDDCLVDPGYDEVMDLLERGGPGPDDGETMVPAARGSDLRKETDRRGSRGPAAESPDRNARDGDDEPPPPRSRRREPDEDRPEPAPAKARRGADADPTADDLCIKKGGFVFYKGEEYEVLKVSGDGTSLTLEDQDGGVVNGVAPADVKKVKTAGDPEPAPAKPRRDMDDEDDAPRGRRPEPDEGEPAPRRNARDGDDDIPFDEDDAPAPRSRARR